MTPSYHSLPRRRAAELKVDSSKICVLELKSVGMLMEHAQWTSGCHWL